MNALLISNWNACVAPDDTVYHLGDFAMGDRAQIPALLEQLNGNLVLVPGNHDNKRDDKYFPVTLRCDKLLLDVGGHSVELVHNPAHVTGAGEFALCGHVHEKWLRLAKGQSSPAYAREHRAEPAFVAPCDILNVGVDQWQYRPVTLGEVINTALGRI
jgi:calcineurin-like phosphoesterase family protein